MAEIFALAEPVLGRPLITIIVISIEALRVVVTYLSDHESGVEDTYVTSGSPVYNIVSEVLFHPSQQGLLK